MEATEQPQQPGWRCSASGRWRRRESPGHRAQRRLRQMDRLAAVALASLARLQQHHGSAMPRILDSMLSQARASAIAGIVLGDRQGALSAERASSLSPTAPPFVPAAARAGEAAVSPGPAQTAASARADHHDGYSEAVGGRPTTSARVTQAPFDPPAGAPGLFLELTEWNQMAQASWRHMGLAHSLAQFYSGGDGGGGGTG